jgi:ribonucleoside-diphosphate reductase alpha chain
VDNAIAKTINVAADFPFAEFSGLYEFAYESGLKGCTVFRQHSRRGEVLTAADESPRGALV